MQKSVSLEVNISPCKGPEDKVANESQMVLYFISSKSTGTIESNQSTVYKNFSTKILMH